MDNRPPLPPQSHIHKTSRIKLLYCNPLVDGQPPNFDAKLAAGIYEDVIAVFEIRSNPADLGEGSHVPLESFFGRARENFEQQLRRRGSDNVNQFLRHSIAELIHYRVSTFLRVLTQKWVYYGLGGFVRACKAFESVIMVNGSIPAHLVELNKAVLDYVRLLYAVNSNGAAIRLHLVCRDVGAASRPSLCGSKESGAAPLWI